MADDYCIDDERKVTREPILRWLLDFFIKARTHGALIGELHDKTYEERISELEHEVGDLKSTNERLNADNVLLANELVDRQNIIDSYEKFFRASREKN